MAEATAAPEASGGQETSQEKVAPVPNAPKMKKEKPPKAPKEGKGGKKNRHKKGEEGEEKRRGFPKILFFIAFLLALLLVAGVMFFFDLFSLRSNILNAANHAIASLDPNYRPYDTLLTERENALDEREDALNARENDLRQQEAALVGDNDNLDKRAAALTAREKAFKEQQLNSTPLFRREISEEKLTELKNLGKIYSTMEPDAAAQALSLLSGAQEMSEVLFYMDNTAAAALMAALNPEIAAQITREMLRE